jgi:hypothetical protein
MADNNIEYIGMLNHHSFVDKVLNKWVQLRYLELFDEDIAGKKAFAFYNITVSENVFRLTIMDANKLFAKLTNHPRIAGMNLCLCSERMADLYKIALTPIQWQNIVDECLNYVALDTVDWRPTDTIPEDIYGV